MMPQSSEGQLDIQDSATASPEPPAGSPPEMNRVASSPPPEGWERHVDVKTGVPYYHNPTKQQTSWEKPEA